MAHSRCLAAVALLLCAGLLATPAAFAQSTGLIFIAPMRVVFGPNDQSQKVTITNRKNQAMTYSLSLLNSTMGPDGVLTEAPVDSPHAADRMLRFMPQDFSLQPGDRQSIRMLVRRPEGLASGDYFTHLLIKETPLTGKFITSLTDVTQPNKAGFEVTTLVENAIPVMVQHGAISSSLAFNAFDPASTTREKLGLTFTRTGNAMAVAYVRVITPAGVDVTTPRTLRLYRSLDAYTIKLERTDAGQKYAGPATVLITENSQANAKVLQQAAISIPFIAPTE